MQFSDLIPIEAAVLRDNAAVIKSIAGPLLYVAVACRCGWTWRRIQLCRRRANVAVPSAGFTRRCRFWSAAAILLLTLAAAAMFGWLDAPAAIVRRLASREGWYADRWWVQGPVVAVMAALVLAAVAIVWRKQLGWYKRDKLALSVLVLLCAFVSMRAVSQHHVDEVLYYDLLHVSLGRWIELAALALLSLTAMHTARCRGDHAAGTPSRCGTNRWDSSARRTVSTRTDVSNGLYTVAKAR